MKRYPDSGTPSFKVFCIFYLLGLLLLSSCQVHDDVKKETDSNSSYAYFKWKLQFEQYINIAGEKDSYYHDFLKSKLRYTTIHSFRTDQSWRFLGPDNIYGRTLSLAINPKDTSELWMGSACSGLWHSINGGVGDNAWTHVPLGFPVQSVSSIAIQNDKPDVIYIGTGETYSINSNSEGIVTRTLRGSRGIGLLKSSDNGKNWNLLLNMLDQPSSCIWKICINPKNNNQIFIAGTMGIMKSEDGGTHWISVMDSCLVTALEIDPEIPSILYAGVRGTGILKTGLYKSEDGGEEWIKLSNSNLDELQGRIMIDICKDHPERVIAAFSDSFNSVGILRTLDRFTSTSYWTNIKDVCEHQGWYANGLLLKDDDPTKLLMGGVDLYYDSSGTGNKLQNLVYKKIKIHADFHDILSNPKDPNKVYFLTDGGVFRSNDFSKSVFSCNSGYVSTQFYTGNIDLQSKNILGGLQDNKTALFTNADKWTTISIGDGTFNAFHPLNESYIFISSQFQNLYSSEDLGKTSKELIPPNENASFVAPFILDRNNPETIMSGGDQLWISHNSGITWIKFPLSRSGEKIVAIDQDNWNSANYFIATYLPENHSSALYRYMDGQTSMAAVNFKDTTRFIRCIQSDPHLPKHWYITLGNYGPGGILESIDDGTSWDYCLNEGLPNVPVHTLFVDPVVMGQLYAGCDLGLFVSFDAGHHWIPYNDHPYDMVPVYDIKYSKSTNELLLFTHGYGVFSLPKPQKPVTGDEQYEDTKQGIYCLKGASSETFIMGPDNMEFGYLIGIDGTLISIKATGRIIDARSCTPGVYILLTKEGFRKKCILL